ncbi:hypothetical protein EON65_42815, partial [archaeon]
MHRYIKEEEYKAKHRASSPSSTPPSSEDEGGEGIGGSVMGTMVVRELGNGDRRVCIESGERKKREDILRKLGVLEEAEERRGKGGGRGKG